MRQQDLFEEPLPSDQLDYSNALRAPFMKEIVAGTLQDIPDWEVANAIIILARDQLIACGNGEGHTLSDGDFQLLLRAGIACCKRMEVSFPDFPFRDFTGFKSYWRSQGWTGGGSYAIRREYIQEQFRSVELAVFQFENALAGNSLLNPVDPGSYVGWIKVDSEVLELRRRFESAKTEQDFCSVGSSCVRILECLGETVFEPSKHLAPGTPNIPRSETKNRLEAVINFELKGPKNDKFRKAARSIIELDQEVKHSKTPTRADAAIACDATIFLVNMMRHLDGVSG